VEYSNQLWWEFAFSGNAPRFMRASIGVIGMAVLFSGLRLFRPSAPDLKIAGANDISLIAPIVKQSEDTYANLAMLGDKQLLLNEKKNAFIMYGIEGRSWIAMGDPVGPANEKSALAWQFHELANRYGGWTVFYEVSAENLQIYLDLGLTMVKLGEEARVPLTTFSLEGSAKKTLRYILKKLSGEGCTFEILPSTGVESLLPELKKISDAWLTSKQTREKSFSLGSFDPDYLKQFPVAIIRFNGAIAAFANLWAGTEKEEISVDLMRYLPNAPNGIMDYLLLQSMLWGKVEGYRWFNLGMAPLSGFEKHDLAPLWNRAGLMIARYGENFYNFKGLRQYKDKFDPVWSPKYLAYPGGMVLPRIFVNLATLVSGGLSGILHK
jgi:phosphatidylglycerol lysyltransferase